MIEQKKFESIVLKAGDMLEKAFYQNKNIYTKSTNYDLITDTDKSIELFLKEKFTKLLPESEFLAEETDPAHKYSKYLWIIDPIDGTTNFVHKYPFVCISVALMIDNVLSFAITYNPIMKELFYAEKSKGAYLNNTRIHVSTNTDFSKSLLGTGFAYNFVHSMENNFNFFKEILPCVHGIRRAGSAALDLAYVAKGVFDGFWEWYLNPWDVCAGILLIKEAGGIVTNIYHQDWRFEDQLLIAGSKEMHGKLYNKIQEIGFKN